MKTLGSNWRISTSPPLACRCQHRRRYRASTKPKPSANGARNTPTREFILEEGKYWCGSEVEKMSKSEIQHRQHPNDSRRQNTAQTTYRMYEMFLRTGGTKQNPGIPRGSKASTASSANSGGSSSTSRKERSGRRRKAPKRNGRSLFPERLKKVEDATERFFVQHRRQCLNDRRKRTHRSQVS